MAIDPSIIMGIQQPKFENPLDLASKAMTMQNMGYQNYLQQRQMSDDQATRSAFQAATTAGPDGTPTLDRGKFTSTLAQQNPMLAYQKAQEFPAQDAAKAKAQLEIAKNQHEQAANLLSSIPRGPGVDPTVQQAAYEKATQAAIAAGFPGAQNAPKQYPGDSFIQNALAQTLDAKDQLTYQQKEQENKLKHEEHALTREDHKIRLGDQQMAKQNQTFHNTQQMLETAKGNPAVGQAEKDIYAGQKVKSLIAQAGDDPNNMNMTMVHLLTSEVGKMASGGVPTVDELKGLTPGAVPQIVSKAAEVFDNHPTPANAGAFVKQLSDYADSISKDGQRVIEDKYGRVIEANKDDLSPKHYKALKSNYVDRFKSSDPTSQYHGMSDEDLDKAYKAAGGK